MIDLRKLRYFSNIVEAKSISRAAHSLNVAQPALSKSIQALEEELGTPLLQRSAKGVATTEAGARLYEHCQIIFKQLDRARLDVRKAVERPSGVVTVGLPHSLMTVLALPMLQLTTERYPDVRLELKQEHSHVLSGNIRAGKLDFAIMASPRSASGLFCQPLLEEELLFVEPVRRGEKARGIHISFIEASRHEFILPSVGNGLRAAAEGHFRSRSLPLNVKYEVDAIALITQCVEAGLGVSLLPGGCLRMDINQGRVRVKPFAEGGCHRSIVLCHAAEATLSPAAATVVSLVEEAARDLVVRGQWSGARLA
ncbi:LysR family transcriptional regulator [Limobrevibacterium gyesilva]|uniref:LysR substrate-binding domain-containing protein n=1 Tax=Limobrevibacterium gyesilva TaxID=2991712 RepID=A0AA41YLZ7_9PROT|nr:LysR substrate-binding domain-containing protein [Limobrevibacterium gyesilva]MCW3474926.1 LysR substrate-binding domain-containing protein [Limobrevibacterium gyesilva]